MKILIISPTYNEKNNIETLIKKVWLSVPNAHILIIDDNSPDGTASIVKSIMQTNDNIFIIERKSKLGLGTAYCEGFKWAIDRNYDRIVQIDADLSHNPEDIPKMLETCEKYDLVLGSRYITGVNVVHWPMSRLLLSYFANIYARVITGLPVYDATGGFKCYKREVLESLDLLSITAEGYSFQIETSYLAWRKGFSIKEIPIIFIDRTVGKSKMTRKIIYEAVWVVLKLRLKRILGIK